MQTYSFSKNINMLYNEGYLHFAIEWIIDQNKSIVLR
jgi:hypothetical protein